MGRAHLSPEQLSALADGELGPDELGRAREHLFGCATCSGQYRSIQELDLGLRQLQDLSCDAVLPLLAARSDGELDGAENALAERHLTSCAACRQMVTAWSSIAPALALLPTGEPSERVDRAIAALVTGRARPAFRPVLLPRALVAAAAAVALVVGILSRGAPVAQVATPNGPQVLVAAAQEIVLNPRTNTLYVLDPKRAAVDARDATTNDLKTRIDVGGRPTALALNASANVVLVLDASAKTVTEIDSVSNTIVGSTAVAVSGTPTSISVDPSNNKILVTSGGASTSGSVAVIDGTTKKVESVRDFDVAPEQMVFSPQGDRAVIVSTKASTLVDSSYTVLSTLPGGVGAAFAQGDDRIAILTARGDGAVVNYVGRAAPGSLHLAGTPQAIVSLPDGGFLVLVDLGDRSRVSYLAPDGHEAGNVDLAIAGRDLVYDPAARRFSVANGGQVVSADVPQVIAAASPTPAVTPSPSIAPSALAAASPAPSGSPVPSGSPSPSASATPNPLAQASPTSPAFVHIDLPDGREPMLVSKSNETLWVLDDRNGVESVDMSSGVINIVSALPRGAQISMWAAGRDYVYGVDTRTGDLHVVRTSDDSVRSYALKFLKPVTSVAVGTDDRLWIGLSGASYLLAFDPRTAKTDSFDLAGAHVSKLTIDTQGRILYADDARSAVGIYDPLRARISEVRFARAGATTGLVLDGAGTLWLSTDRGEIYAVSQNRATLVAGLRRPVTTLSLDVRGRAWYLAPLPTGAIGFGYATADGVTPPVTIDGPASSLDLSALGRAWLADPRGGFYVSRSSN